VWAIFSCFGFSVILVLKIIYYLLVLVLNFVGVSLNIIWDLLWERHLVWVGWVM